MDARYSPRTSQKADVRPISFLLDNLGSIGDPVMLPIRPEDLTRTEPARATVHQTLGREEVGWVDHFGKGLASINISGTTGWRYNPSVGRDGFQSFEALNDLVVHRYPELKQDAIDAGRDPRDVKLIFVDLLDNFTYPVVPTQFVLRRSKSRPLLFQYSITLQALSGSIDAPIMSFPSLGSITGGLGALGRVMDEIDGFIAEVEGWVSKALSFVDNLLAPVASAVKAFVVMVNNVLRKVDAVVRGVNNVITGTANRLIGIAQDLAGVGANVFRTINGIISLPSNLKANLGRVASAFNEVLCIFGNSLRPRKNYQQYDDLYGASNCSSTTGGRMPSPFAGRNVFELMQAAPGGVKTSSEAMSGISILKRSDPVLAPMPFAEVGRHLENIVSGVVV
jgi:hypothetical protein